MIGLEKFCVPGTPTQPLVTNLNRGRKALRNKSVLYALVGFLIFANIYALISLFTKGSDSDSDASAD